MGEVWKAHDSATDRIVAVKVLNKQFADDDGFQLRFHREARAAAGLNDPHVVPIHGYGEVDGRLYVEMRLIEGRGLDEIVKLGPLWPERAVGIVEQIASALDAAHRVGLVHRDVKPSNILLTGDDFAYLIDFGIARATGDIGLTQTGFAMGTWAYMAPERIRSNAVDARSDVYALACVLHECLTGARPFAGNSFEELASAHLWVLPPVPSKIHDTVPVGFDAVIAAGMAKELTQRYRSVKELAQAARIACNPYEQQTMPAMVPVTLAPPLPMAADVEVLAGTITGDLADPVWATGDSPRSFDWPPADDPDRAPYRGWQPFEPADAGIFFGRDAQIVRAVDAVAWMRQAKNKTWFVVLGPSGSGKSAFLRAGLLPRLQRAHGEYLVLPIIRPERDAIDGVNGLAAAIHTARQAFSLDGPTLGEIKAACGDDPRRVRELLIEVQQAAATGSDADSAPTLVMPLDQAEELLAADTGPHAQAFLQLITELAKPSAGERLNLIVAATIRTDRFESLQTRPELADAEMELFAELKPMPPERFREVILGPATAPADVKRQLAVSAELVERLLADCREGGDTLPLLSLTLARLYEDYGSSKVLTLAQYQQMGGLQRVVRSEIDAVLSRTEPQRSEQLTALRAAFIPWLATISPDTDQPLRRVARYEDLPHASRPLVDALVARRLLVKDVRDGHVVVEVALESLLRQWDELAGWLRTERSNLKAADELERASATWESASRDPAWLLTGSRLVEAETLIGAPGFSERLSSARYFISNSRRAENYRLNAQEQQRQHELHTAYERQATAEAHAVTLRTHAATLKKRSRVLRAVLAVAIVIAVAAAALGVFSFTQRQAALKQRNAAIALRLNTEAKDILAGDRPGGDNVAFHKLLAARTLAPPDDGALVHAIAERTNILKVFDTGASVQGLAVSPDGHRLATGGDDATVRLWNADTGQPIGQPLTGHTDTVYSVAFSPDGHRLATGSGDDTVRLWNADTGEPVGEPLTPDAGDVDGVVFSPNGYRLATANVDGTVRLWNVRTGQPIGAPLTGHTDQVNAVAFSPDGHRLATGSEDNTVRLWNADNGQPIGSPLTGHADAVYGVAFSPDGHRLATASRDATVRLWNADTGQPIGQPLIGHTNTVFSVAFSPDGHRLATGSGDHTVRLWNADTGQPIGQPLSGHSNAVLAAVFLPDGRRLASAGYDDTVRIWDTNNPLSEQTGDVDKVAFSPDGHRLASNDGNTVRLWDADSDQPIGSPLTGHTDLVYSLAFSPDGHRLATGSRDHTVRLWNADTGQPIGEPLTGHTNSVMSTVFSPDGHRLASASADKTVRLWNADTGQAFRTTLDHDDEVNGVAFSPDGHRLATASNDWSVRLWNADTGQPIGQPLTGHTNWVTSVAFSPDGHRLASASFDGTVRLWNADTGQPIGQPLTAHTDSVNGVAFSPDGHRLASASFDGTVRLWNADTGAPFGDPLTGHAGRAFSVAFSPDGRRLASVGEDHTVRLWDVEASPQLLCDKLSENMSHKQWQEQVSPDVPYVTLCPGLPVAPD
jgi:WD40 repeat protein